MEFYPYVNLKEILSRNLIKDLSKRYKEHLNLPQKQIVLENREENANLFSIIEDSLVLARNSFNRYGNH